MPISDSSVESFDVWAESYLRDDAAYADHFYNLCYEHSDECGLEFWRGYLAALRAFSAQLTFWKHFRDLHSGGADVYDE